MDELKTIQFILYKDRIEMKGKETNTTYVTWDLENFKKNPMGNISSLFFEMNIRKSERIDLEFKDLSTQ